MQILAGNARKVSAVRFERVNNDEASPETKEVTRFMPKIMKRRYNSDDELDRTEVDESPFNEMANDYVTSVQEDTNDQVSKL